MGGALPPPTEPQKVPYEVLPNLVFELYTQNLRTCWPKTHESTNKWSKYTTFAQFWCSPPHLWIFIGVGGGGQAKRRKRGEEGGGKQARGKQKGAPPVCDNSEKMCF